GGERYLLTLVATLAAQGWQTGLLWDHKPIHRLAQTKFNLDLGHTAYLPTYHFTHSIAHKISFMQKFDLAFIVSDGSIPLMAAKQNILHFQVPFHDIKGRKLANQLKKHSIHHFVANSHFTKDIVDDEYGINCKVIYPPIDVRGFHAARKQNIILYVARFSNLLQSKGHSEVIQAFKQLYDSGTKNYRLWLAGSTEVGSQQIIKQLRAEAKGYPIEITLNPPYSDVQELFSIAKYFWAAAGYNVSETQQPEKCEHFGITTVEAMASGCVPLAVRKGGFREIIQH
ncbi:MAG: glycosyltransferase family 4 protein, partial [Bdellovibrionales bacterium]|nr:glycosyltransferase family 4 protein [Bdellovibrionales bacterium]